MLVTLAVLLLLSPAIVGRIAEKNLDQNLGWIQDENDDITITAESFQRGWFTSEGRHRVSMKPASLLQTLTAGNGQSGGAPTLIIDTHLDHGLVPVTSMGREEGSLQPGIARTVSTLQVDRGDGNAVDLPGTVYSTIGLTGHTAFRYLADPGSRAAGGVETTWAGADLTLTATPASRSYALSGTVEPMSIESDGIRTDIGAVTIDASQDRSRFAFGIGHVTLDIASMTVGGDGLAESGFGKLALRASTALDDGRLTGRSTLGLDDIIMPDLGRMDLDLDMTVSGLDPEPLEVIVAAFRDAQASPVPDAAMDALYPKIEPDLQKLVRGGADIEIRQFDLSLPEGRMLAALKVGIPPSAASGSFSWPGVLLAMTASLDITVSASLYDMMLAMDPQVGALTAMGILQRRGDDYEMNAEFASGLLTINGAPMPIPIGAIR